MANKVHKSSAEYMTQQKVELLGKSVRYIGVGGREFTCPTCSRSFSRGMTFEHNKELYCSRKCIV